MDVGAVIARIYEHLENDDVEKAVMACLRASRHSKDYLNAAGFMRELHPDKDEVGRMIYDDTNHLTKDAQKFVWEKSLDRWLNTHDLGFSFENDAHLPKGEQRTVLKVAAGEIEHELDQWEKSISDMTVPAGMAAFDTAAFTDRFLAEKAQMRLRIKALQTIKARLKTRCLNYAIQMERQLASQREAEGFLTTVQNEVNNYFKARSDEVFSKLQKAASLSASAELEDASLLLTEVRRTLKAAADHFYPPLDKPVTCSDGVQRILDDAKYMNRLHEFIAQSMSSSSATELLAAELEALSLFTRRLDKIASKGVHSSVTFAEARQGLVGLYFFLFNVTQHLTGEATEA
jgi:hypothetical protein